jgi:sigma-B regulation protein RsbU (phosphoserine phosphatase)
MKIGIKISFVGISLALLGYAVGELASEDIWLEVGGVFVLAAAIAVLLARQVTAPLNQLQRWFKLISANDLQEPADTKSSQETLNLIATRQDEIGELSRSIQQINEQFFISMQRLQQNVADKERMETELRIGRSIQLDLLALGPANLPKHKALNLFAYLEPAREVGGDFYDCYFLPEKVSNLLRDYSYRFCFCIGDTSGKGVPAALFTTVIKTMIKSQSYVDPSPKKILTRVNQVVSENNPSCMFTTIFMGVLNLLSGELTYTLAGHNPPYLRRADGSLEKLADRHGPPLGVVDNFVYGESTILCTTGDLLISYTDGVTEAMDFEGQLFSDQRLLELLTAAGYDLPQDAIQVITQAVSEFQGQAEQADDITILSFKYLGTPIEASEFSEFSILEAAISDIRENAISS